MIYRHNVIYSINTSYKSTFSLFDLFLISKLKAAYLYSGHPPKCSKVRPKAIFSSSEKDLRALKTLKDSEEPLSRFLTKWYNKSS